MPVQFSPKHFSNLLKFWVCVLVLSGVGVGILALRQDSSAQLEPIVINEDTSGVPLLFPPRIADIVPVSDAASVVLDIEDPIVVRFTDSVKPYHIRFELEPQAEFFVENNPEKTEFRLLPKESLRPGTRYTFNVSYVSRETPDAAYKPLTETNFTTLAPAPSPASASVTSATVARRTEGKYIDVDIARQVMVLFENGKQLDSYLVSSGKRGMDTPKGEFSVANKAPRPWSKTYGLYMPYWMAFTGDGKYGIHELPEWPSGYKEGADHLGHPVSHGCIRLGVASARRVYEWADVGTPIIIH